MRYDYLYHAVQNHIWAILPEKYEEIVAFLRLKRDGAAVPDEKIEALNAGRRPGNVQMVGRVAVLPVFGVLGQRMSMLEESSGGVSAEAVGATLDGLVADKGVRSIVMAFDSPGGSIFGIQELGNKIHGYRGEKKIVGIADSLCASAAFWLLCQCQEANVTLGGVVGAIGCFATHQDTSAKDEKDGVKTTVIAAGKYKSEAAAKGPMSEEHQADIQAKVNAYYADFVGAVAKGRGVTEHRVEKDFGQGRVVLARDAVAAGMVDHVSTMAQVLHRLGADPNQGVATAMAAARARAVEVSER